MRKYRLSQAAKGVLIFIAQYGDEYFGIQRSDDYRDLLERRFSEIVENPDLYPLIEHIHSGYRRSVFRGHSIYYRIDEQGITIMRILGRQDTDEAL